jgi:uncharacterized membrane protein
VQDNRHRDAPQPVTGRTRDAVIIADKAIFRLARHWLLLANLFWGLYVGLPFLAPLFMNAGWTTPGKIVYLIYRPACHQRPERSYFLTGPQAVYTPEELAAAGVDLGPLSRDIGNEEIGWKVAFCERDVAIYGSILAAGLVYAGVRQSLRARPRPGGGWKMPFKLFLLFAVPMGIDGLAQLFTSYESTWLARSLTGGIFGVGAVFFAYPYLEEGFRDVRRTVNQKLHLE